MRPEQCPALVLGRLNIAIFLSQVVEVKETFRYSEIHNIFRKLGK